MNMLCSIPLLFHKIQINRVKSFKKATFLIYFQDVFKTIEKNARISDDVNYIKKNIYIEQYDCAISVNNLSQNLKIVFLNSL